MLLDDVRRALALPRPGRAAQMRMSPRPRPGDIYPLPPEIKAREAAVIILLYPRADSLDFILTRRTETVDTHKGQISLPGGAQEKGESLEQTALREASEELGIDLAGIEILGRSLTPIYVPISGFRVTPFVGFSRVRPELFLETEEVGEVIEAPLELLLQAESVGEEEWELHGFVSRVPYFNVKGYKVWGATGMILSEFSEMLQTGRRAT